MELTALGATLTTNRTRHGTAIVGAISSAPVNTLVLGVGHLSTWGGRVMAVQQMFHHNLNWVTGMTRVNHGSGSAQSGDSGGIVYLVGWTNDEPMPASFVGVHSGRNTHHNTWYFFPWRAVLGFTPNLE